MSCGAIRYHITPIESDGTTLADVYILNLDGSNSKINFNQLDGSLVSSTTELIIYSSSSTNRLSFDSTDHNLITDETVTPYKGIYKFSIRAYLDSFPLMEEFHVITSTFTLTITDVCSAEVIIAPIINDMLFTLDVSPLPEV